MRVRAQAREFWGSRVYPTKEGPVVECYLGTEPCWNGQWQIEMELEMIVFILSRNGAPRLRVNRGACRFGRYQNPRRPHPPAHRARVSPHPAQVSCLTLAPPGSPTSVRSTNRLTHVGVHVSSFAKRGRNGLPTTVSLLGCHRTRRHTHPKYKSGPLPLFLPSSRLVFSFNVLSPAGGGQTTVVRLLTRRFNPVPTVRRLLAPPP